MQSCHLPERKIGYWVERRMALPSLSAMAGHGLNSVSDARAPVDWDRLICQGAALTADLDGIGVRCHLVQPVSAQAQLWTKQGSCTAKLDGRR